MPAILLTQKFSSRAEIRRAYSQRGPVSVCRTSVRHIIARGNDERTMSGYYYDWIREQWRQGERTTLTHAERVRCGQRRTLLMALLTEIRAGGDSVTTLYAQLLARHLITRDEALMREFGRVVVNQTGNAAHERADPDNQAA
jgi:hypothetical protein